MGLFFTLLYVLTAYLSPQVVFGPLSEYHIEIVIAVITLAFSLLNAEGSGVLQLPQTYAIMGLTFMVGVSLLFVGWLGGVAQGLQDFVPNAMAFFFVVWNCRTKRHLQLLLLVMLFAAFFIIYNANTAIATKDYVSPYIMTMRDDDFIRFFRIRGLSFLNDPNDFAQFLVSLIPMTFFFWGKERAVTNVLLVYGSVGLLLYGIFLTHSRGAMVAMMVTVIVAFRRKIGVVPAILGGGLLFMGMVATGFSGNREVNAGEDRMEAWSRGFQLIRGHPIVGVGYKRFTEYHDVTAHNTVVVTAAELGLVGLFFFMLFILPTVRDVMVASAVRKIKGEGVEDDAAETLSEPTGVPALARPGGLAYSDVAIAGATGGRFPLRTFVSRNREDAPAQVASSRRLRGAPVGFDDEEDPKQVAEEARRMTSVMLVSMSGFLAAGWFLSRPYTMILFLNAGIAAVTFRMVRETGVPLMPLPISRAAKLAAIAGVIILFIIYVMVRIDHLMPK